MKPSQNVFCGLLFLLAVSIEIVQPLCVLESDFGFKINCAFKKSGLFRVRNLGGIKAHASLGFSLGDELGFEQSLTNQDPSRRRSVSFKNGAPNILVDTSSRPAPKQEKRAKQNRIMMRPMAPVSRPNQSAMDKLSTLHRRVSSTMQPIVISGPIADTPMHKAQPTVTMAKPMPMGVPPFRPLPPKEETLRVVPLAASKKTYSPLQAPQASGAPYQNPVPHQVHDIANMYSYNTKKVDDYNSISGYSDDITLKFNKDDINTKIAEIAKAGNISMEAVEAAIALRQQQLLSKYANIPVPTTTTSTTTTTTTEAVVFQLEPEPEIIVAPVPNKPKRNPTSGKVMNAPREYYPVGYEKNFDDHFQSKVDLPDTNFHCGDQKYFPGLYGDENLGCMVFHVCALTDDGLVMKSFLCPESTLFDQTILKCNWWFYVDCKNTMKLYDTNIPVSKSYQLMKALTFFSSYKKEMEDGQPMNPEDVEGIKSAITILENQDSKPQGSENIEIVTPSPNTLPVIDERHSHKNNTTSPVYRGTRDYTNSTEKRNQRRNPVQTQDSEEYKLITLNANINFNNTKSSENKSSENSSERKRRRMVSRNNYTPTTKSTTPVTTPTTTTTSTTTQAPVEVTTPSIEIIKQEIQSIEEITPVPEQQAKLTDQIENLGEIDYTILREGEHSPPVRRFYRSSQERDDAINKEIEIVNNEKVQIVRPTSSAQLVGEYPTQTATIAKLDEAVLGRKVSGRFKKEAITIVVPTNYAIYRSPTRDRT
ncbi:uncharacterized protein LOC124538934 isoform X2 [Vanessa cardui]|uniref:uncharacterized protein LOC124538934 isoform X2 n=1 Tax=Vanessa cardui TaxID=171605 RepID=UPI001F1330B8|nr:uncharacterized protein LOC124538934 isoform X2 [Vanessa cardui]